MLSAGLIPEARNRQCSMQPDLLTLISGTAGVIGTEVHVSHPSGSAPQRHPAAQAVGAVGASRAPQSIAIAIEGNAMIGAPDEALPGATLCAGAQPAEK